MKKYKIDLKDYEVDGKVIPVKEELSGLLRLPGVYKDGIETCDGVMLARTIEACDDGVMINEKDLTLLKKVMDILIAREHKPQIGQLSLGGVRYGELILRVFMADKE